MDKYTLERFKSSDKQILGVLTCGNYSCKTLELPWKNNEFSISCIPTGEYKVIKRNSAKYGDHFHVLNVESRSYILIHHGNYYNNTKGCILVGHNHADINNDGYYDVTSSRDTMEELNNILPDAFILKIIDNNG